MTAVGLALLLWLAFTLGYWRGYLLGVDVGEGRAFAALDEGLRMGRGVVRRRGRMLLRADLESARQVAQARTGGRSEVIGNRSRKEVIK